MKPKKRKENQIEKAARTGEPQLFSHDATGRRDSVCVYWPDGEGIYYYRDLRGDLDKLQQIIACAYQLAGVHDAPENWLDALANPLDATQEQINTLLPYYGGANE